MRSWPGSGAGARADASSTRDVRKKAEEDAVTTWFTPALFTFLADLAENNQREWFQANRVRYERDVRDPMLLFIAALQQPLEQIAPEVVADPRPVGGSLFRIHRDTRFAKDKSPYKTHVAAHFRHRAGRDVHAPGFYLHLAPGEVVAGAGLWRPDPAALKGIRDALVAHPDEWRRLTSAKAFRAAGHLEGESAKRVPVGFAADHPLAEDLKRKDFTVIARWPQQDALAPDLLKRYVRFCRDTSAVNGFLARALGLPW
jgi:uncharacterized protein (TIGR02453 family)